MEPDEYERMDRVEDAMWWYRALHHRVLAALRRNPGDPGLPLLDAGCGTGGLLRRLADAFPTRQLVGVDVAAEAARRARRKVPGAAVAVGSIDALPFGDGRFGAAVSCDVLCHRLVAEAAALAGCAACWRPAASWCSTCPRIAGCSPPMTGACTTHGATTARGCAGCSGAGFRPIALGYWNSLLLPLMVVQRKVLGRFRGAEASDVAPFSPPIDAIFRAVTETEAALARLGVRFPAGGSLLAIARRP